jgi:hypothetical protein
MSLEKTDVEIILDVLKDAAPRELHDRTNRELAIIADLVEDKQIRGGVFYPAGWCYSTRRRDGRDKIEGAPISGRAYRKEKTKIFIVSPRQNGSQWADG